MIAAVDSLVPGLIVDKDVDVRGTILLKTGTCISEANIQQLRKWHVEFVSVREAGSPTDVNGAATLLNPDKIVKETQRLEALFATTGDDKQMLMLKNSLLRQLSG